MRISGRGISDEIIFFCQRKSSGAFAKGCFIVGGFKVFKGSKVSSYICDNLKSERYRAFYKLRLALEDEGIISDGIFQRDYIFSSASFASTVILGSSSNGNDDWRTEDGTRLGEMRSGGREIHRKPRTEQSITAEIFTSSRDDSESARLILTKYFPDGFNTKINLDYMKFRNYAESEGITFPPENESLRRIIESEGTNLGGSIFIISKELTDETGRLISAIQDTKADVIFYSPLMNELMPVLNQNHIYSLEMFRDFLIAKFPMLFYHKDSFTFSNTEQDQAVLNDILRVWGDVNTLHPSELEERLPYIPRENIALCLKTDSHFERTAEGKYFLMRHFYVTSRESAEIYRYVEESCRADGYAAIVNIPCESVRDNNSELTGDGLYTAIFDTVLKGRFYRKYKIITDTPEGPNIIAVFKNYCRHRTECTINQLNEFAREITGTVYHQGVLNALYDSMIRITKEKFTADYNIEFDIEGIDRAISLFMDGEKFIPIRGITTFAAFPDCGVKWNHYILESFCYRFSGKYELRFFVEVSKNLTRFNNSNTGIIAEKNLDMTYNEILAEMLSRQRFDFTEENAGKYFHDTGLMKRKKFTGLNEILSRAERIREGRN